MATTSYGDGSVKEIAPGKWRLRVYLGRDPVTGRPVQKSRTVEGNKTEAKKALKAMVAEADAEKIEPTTLTVGGMLTQWLNAIERTRAPSTVAEVRKKIARYVSVPLGSGRPALGSIPLTKLTAHHLDLFYDDLLGKNLSTTTVRQCHAIVAAALRQGEKWGWVNHSPARMASPPTARKVQMKIPTPEELLSYIRAADDAGDAVLSCAITLAALTGLRRGELAALRWSDVEVNVGILSVSRSLTVVDKTTHVGPTKTHQVRRVALDDVALASLAFHRKRQEDLSRRAGSPLVDDPYVLSFNANGGRSVNPDTLTHRFSAICGSKYRLHDLRHFSVSTLISAGVNVRTVAERHGHVDASTTLRVYAHALPQDDRDAAGILGRALTPQLAPGAF
jgi:integrase